VTKRSIEKALNIHDLEALARARLPRGLFEFIARGSEDEVTAAENLARIKSIALLPRVAVDVSQRTTASSLFGRTQAMPVVMGVIGFSGMISYRGEEAVAAAAMESDIPYTLGTFNLTSIGALTERLRERLWYQLYPAKQRAVFDQQVDNAERLGIQALVVTLDSAVSGNRGYPRRSGFALQARPTPSMLLDVLRHPRWLCGTYLRQRWPRSRLRLGNVPAAYAAAFDKRTNIAGITFGDDFTRDCPRRLRDRWPRRLILKGISTVPDALRAVERGADGTIVSNHGGRALNGCIASMTALPDVVRATRDRATVMVDGGFVRGSNIVKALALGASAVLVGRATMFGLAAAGQAGVARALSILREEMSRSLALLGCNRVTDLSYEHVRLP
jgi:(S)-mandelate dehydrogenase